MTKRSTTDSAASMKHWEDALIGLIRATYPEITGVDFLRPNDAATFDYKKIILHKQEGPASKIVHYSMEIHVNCYSQGAIINSVVTELIENKKWKEDKAHAHTFGHTLY